MREILVAVALSVALSGCVTTAEREAAVAAKDDGQCQTYGAKPGTQAYFTCRMTKDQQRQANRTQLQAAILARPDPQPSAQVYVAPADPYAPRPRIYMNTESGLASGLNSLGRTMELTNATEAE